MIVAATVAGRTTALAVTGWATTFAVAGLTISGLAVSGLEGPLAAWRAGTVGEWLAAVLAIGTAFAATLMIAAFAAGSARARAIARCSVTDGMIGAWGTAAFASLEGPRSSRWDGRA